MEDAFILEKNQRTVQVDGRRFIMREMGAEAFRAYTKRLMDIGQKTKAHIQSSEEDALRETAEAEMELLAMLLAEPVNPDKRADEDFLRGLSLHQRIGIFKLQDELNGMGDLLKKMASLLA